MTGAEVRWRARGAVWRSRFTRSASERAFIFSITRPRCAFTVISLIPSSPPTCLFRRPAHHQRHDLALPAAEQGVAIAQRLKLGLVAQLGGAAVDGVPDGAEKDVFGERLGQELDRAGLHGAHRHGDVAVPGDEDDRHVEPFAGDLRLQIQPAEFGQVDIEDEAAWASATRGRARKSCADAKHSGSPSLHADQRLEGLAHGDIIVDDEHDRRCVGHGRRPRLRVVGCLHPRHDGA